MKIWWFLSNSLVKYRSLYFTWTAGNFHRLGGTGTADTLRRWLAPVLADLAIFLWKRTKLFCSFEISMVYFTYCKVYTQIIDIQKYPTFSNKDGNMYVLIATERKTISETFLGEETPGGQATGLGKMSKSMSSLSSITPGFPCSSGKTMGPGWPRSHTGSSWIWKWQPSFSGHRLRIFHGLTWPCLQVLCLIPLAYMTYTAYFSCLAFWGARGPWWSAGCHDGRCFPTQLCYWSKFEIHSNQGFGHFEAFWWHVWSMNFFSIRVFRHQAWSRSRRNDDPQRLSYSWRGWLNHQQRHGGHGRCPTGWGIFRLKISGWYGPGCQSLLAFEVDMGRKNIQ